MAWPKFGPDWCIGLIKNRTTIRRHMMSCFVDIVNVVGGTGDTLEAITNYTITEGEGGWCRLHIGAGAPVSDCDVFGQHLANEIKIIKTVGIRKRIQIEIMHFVYDAQHNGVGVRGQYIHNNSIHACVITGTPIHRRQPC